MDNRIAVYCQDYAGMLCKQRELNKGADMLLEMAPEEALEYLDTIKRVMDIDPDVMDPKVVLLRASVIMER